MRENNQLVIMQYYVENIHVRLQIFLLKIMLHYACFLKQVSFENIPLTLITKLYNVLNNSNHYKY